MPSLLISILVFEHKIRYLGNSLILTDRTNFNSIVLGSGVFFPYHRQALSLNRWWQMVWLLFRESIIWKKSHIGRNSITLSSLIAFFLCHSPRFWFRISFLLSVILWYLFQLCPTILFPAHIMFHSVNQMLQIHQWLLNKMNRQGFDSFLTSRPVPFTYSQDTVDRIFPSDSWQSLL